MSTLAERLAAARVNVLDIAVNGPVERDWLPKSDGLLHRGKRHLAAAEAKSGKSVSFQAHAVAMVAAGATVAVLDRENGADEFGRRLRDILAARSWERELTRAVETRLHYYAYPDIKMTDGPALAQALQGVDLVIFDSSRMFLTLYGLDEDSNNDYAKWQSAIIEVLARAGIATLILDNVGHDAKGRPRGGATKMDLNEVIFTLKAISPPSPERVGRLRLTCTHSRFGQTGNRWEMDLGGGTYGPWLSVEVEADTSGTFRPTGLMERISRTLDSEPGLSKRSIFGAVKGKDEYKALALDLLIAEGFVEVRRDGQAHRHHSLQPFREDESPPRGPVAQPWPNRGRDAVEGDRGPVSLPIGDTGHGHGPMDTRRPSTVAQPARDDAELEALFDPERTQS